MKTSISLVSVTTRINDNDNRRNLKGTRVVFIRIVGPHTCEQMYQ
jgi:hypothetical protein